MKGNLRRRLLWWYVGTVTLMLAAFIAADGYSLRQNLLATADASTATACIKTQAVFDDFPGAWWKDPGNGLNLRAALSAHLGPGPLYLWVGLMGRGRDGPDLLTRDQDDSLATAWIPRVLEELPRRDASPVSDAVAPDRTPVRLRACLVKDGWNTPHLVVLGQSAAMLRHTWLLAVFQHGLLALVLVGAFALLGHIVLCRSLRPVQSIAATARAISARDLSLRISHQGETGEIGELITTFNQMIARLEASFSQAERFSGDVSHELNTPLAVMRGELDLALRKPRTQEELLDTVEACRQQVRRMAAMVENLLLLSRMDAKPEGAFPDTVDLSAAVLAAYEEILPRAAARSMTIMPRVAAALPVKGDHLLLTGLVSNLLSNAVRFSPEGTMVVLEACTEGDQAVVRVADQGPGIAPAQRNLVFQRFYRVDQSRDARVGGSGLGLSLVERIARLHLATVDLDDAPGGGLLVTVRMALEQQEGAVLSGD